MISVAPFESASSAACGQGLRRVHQREYMPFSSMNRATCSGTT